MIKLLNYFFKFNYINFVIHFFVYLLLFYTAIFGFLALFVGLELKKTTFFEMLGCTILHSR